VPLEEALRPLLGAAIAKDRKAILCKANELVFGEWGMDDACRLEPSGKHHLLCVGEKAIAVSALWMLCSAANAATSSFDSYSQPTSYSSGGGIDRGGT